MIKKSIQLLRNNPVMILLYAGYMLFTLLIVFFLYPTNMNQFSNPYTFDFGEYIMVMTKMMLASLLMGAGGLVFMSGYAGMLVEAMFTGKTSIASFVPCVKKYFVRILLAGLLLAAMAIGFSILLALITIPFTMMAVMSGNLGASLITVVVMVVIAIAAVPFIIMWYPAIFIDNVGVTQGLKLGMKSGVKNYWKLLLGLFVVYLPIFAYTILNYNQMQTGEIYNIWYIIVCIVVAVIVVILLPAMYYLYHENRPNRFRS